MPSAKRMQDHTAGARRPTCAIIAIGRELLLGRTLDTNSHWLAGRLTELGGSVERISVIDDEGAAIVAELRSAWQRRTGVVITTGGLGPTYDDATLAAVAQAANRPLALHEAALDHVRARYRGLHEKGLLNSGRLTAPRKKMAILPRGSAILDNPIGTAPGVRLTIRGNHLLCLPGVPAEMRGMFEESVIPLLLPLFGARTFLEEQIDSGCNDESILSRLIEPLRERYPALHFKSDATGFNAAGSLRIFLTAHGPNQAALRRQLGGARDALLRALRRAGFVPRT